MSKNLYLSERIKKYLINKTWTGNIRELENFIYRMAVLNKNGEINPPEDDEIIFEEVKITKTGKLKDAEKDMIVDALRKTEGNRTKAAKMLGISVRTLRNKIKEYGLKDI